MTLLSGLCSAPSLSSLKACWNEETTRRVCSPEPDRALASLFLFLSLAPVYTKPKTCQRRETVCRWGILSSMGKAKSQVASLRAGHICQLPHLAVPFSQQKDRWVASLVHQSGRLLAAAAPALGHRSSSSPALRFVRECSAAGQGAFSYPQAHGSGL